MKKMFLFTALIAVVASFTSCVNDADFTGQENADAPSTLGDGNVQFTLVTNTGANVATRAGSGSAETPGTSGIIYGSKDEFAVNNCTLYLFGSADGILKGIIPLKNIGAGNPSEDDQYVYYYPDESEVDAGTYDILAIANTKAGFDVNPTVGTTKKTDFLGHLDTLSYKSVTNTTTGGIEMTNRGDENLAVVIPEKPKTKTEQRTQVSISLERVLARVDVSVNAESEVTCAKITVNQFALANLGNKFYTFRHVANFADAPTITEWPMEWNSLASEHFTKIANPTGYLVDPFFFKKTAEGRGADYDGFYMNRSKDWESLTFTQVGPSITQPVKNYINENCMYKTAQVVGNTTCILFKGSVAPYPEATYKMDAAGNDIENVTTAEIKNLSKLYYFNYKFYSSKKALLTDLAKSKAFLRDPDDKSQKLDENSSDEKYKAANVYVYTLANGEAPCYYTYKIRHWDNGDATTMGDMEFGIVRNCLYQVNVSKILNLGPGEPDREDIPDEGKNLLEVTLNVRPWIIISDPAVEL